MFLAIINDTYSEVKAELSNQKNEFDVGDYFKKVCGHHQVVAWWMGGGGTQKVVWLQGEKYIFCFYNGILITTLVVLPV